MSLRFISYGGGVQSTALLVLAAQQKLAFPAAVFANVGEDSENPATLQYVREVALPFAQAHGLALHEISRLNRQGEAVSLWTQLMREESRSLPIPVRMGNSGAPGNRNCTLEYKVNVLLRWAKAQGATAEEPATVAVGISLDEYQRMRDSRHAEQRLVYPLIDLRLDRTACKQLIAAAGLPVPPKSSCFFCPFQRRDQWQQLHDEQPALFARAQELERVLNARRAALGRDPVFFNRQLLPLAELVSEDAKNQTELSLDDGLSCSPFVCPSDSGEQE